MSEFKPCHMSDYDAIKNLEELFGCCKACPVDCESCAGGVAIAAIKSKISRAQPGNEPLALEQLREMHNEFVIIHRLYRLGSPAEYQNTVAEDIKGDSFFHAYGVLDIRDYGKTWLAYRRPLERGVG